MCPKSIAGLPSSQALPGYLITVHHLCAFLLYLECYLCGGITTKKGSAPGASREEDSYPLDPLAGMLPPGKMHEMIRQIGLDSG